VISIIFILGDGLGLSRGEVTVLQLFNTVGTENHEGPLRAVGAGPGGVRDYWFLPGGRLRRGGWSRAFSA
jgi:hypothetical protein